MTPTLDTVNTVLNATRVRMNDTIKSLEATGGKLLDNSQAFSQQAFNTAWRKQQDILSNLGYTGLKETAIIENLPLVGTQDPARYAYLDWTGYFDGAFLWDSPTLPADMIYPLTVEERPTAQNCQFVPMTPMLDGMPDLRKEGRNRVWQWQGQKLVIPGSTYPEDLRILYVKYMADLDDTDDVRWFEQPIPIARCLDPLAWLVCAEVCGDFVAPEVTKGLRDMFAERGRAASEGVFNRDVKMKQRVNVRRLPRSGRGGSWQGGYGQ